MKLVVLLVLVCSLSLVASESSLWCGQVFDGTDIGTDYSTLDHSSLGIFFFFFFQFFFFLLLIFLLFIFLLLNNLFIIIHSAHWRGFSDSDENIKYDIAVVPADHSELNKFDSRCTRSAVNAKWVRVATNADSHHISDKSLAEGTYHVLVRATDSSSSESIISKSSGFLLKAPLSSNYDCAVGAAVCAEIYDSRPLDIGHTRGPAAGSPEAFAILAAPTVFNFAPGEPTSTSTDDDDDGYSAITKAGIAIGTIVGFCVLVAVLLTLIFGRGEGSYGDTVVARAPHKSPGITHEYH